MYKTEFVQPCAEAQAKTTKNGMDHVTEQIIQKNMMKLVLSMRIVTQFKAAQATHAREM